MTDILKKMIRLFTKTVLAVLSITILLSFLIVIGLQGFIIWLNTNSGGEWLSKQIEVISENSPYDIELKNLSLSGLFTLRAGSLSVLQNEALILNAEKLQLESNPFPIPLRRLSVSLSAEKINVLTLPTSEKMEEDIEEEVKEVSLPDLYFQVIDLGLYINQLTLSDRIIDGGLSTKVEIVEQIKLENSDIVNRGSVKITNLDQRDIIYLPLEVKHHLKVTKNFELVEIVKGDVLNKENYLKLAGKYYPKKETLNAVIEGVWTEIQKINPDITESITLKGQLEGTVNQFSGAFETSTAYKDTPATLSTKIERAFQNISLTNIKGDAKDTVLSGDISYDIENNLADGNLTANFQSFDILTLLTGIKNISGNGNISVNAFANNENQSLKVSGLINKLDYQSTFIEKISIAADVPSIENWKTSTAKLILSNLRTEETIIQKSQINVSPLSKEGLKIVLSANGQHQNPFSVQAKADLYKTEPLTIDLNEFVLNAGQGQVSISGHLKNNIPDITMTTKNLDLKALPFVDLSKIPLEINKLNGALTGTLDQPELSIEYGLQPNLKDAPNTNINGSVQYSDNQAGSDFKITGNGIRSLEGQINIPVGLSLQPFKFDLSENTPLSGNANGVFDLTALSSIFLGEGYHLEGDTNLNLDIAGTIQSPDLNGTLSLKDGVFEEEFYDLKLIDMNAKAKFENSTLTLSSFSANDNAETGRISGNGQVDLSDTKSPNISASLNMNNMHLLRNDQYDAQLNADIDVVTKGDQYIVSGQITPQEIQINLPDQFEQQIPSLNIVKKEEETNPSKPFLEKLLFNVLFKADNQIFVRGWGLDAELGGNLNITGTGSDPLINGQFETIRGRYEELGRRFEIDRAIMRFQGTVPPSPYLDIKTTTEIDDLDAHILITRRATDPKLTFSSTPSLPEDEVLSHILFGEDLSKISPYQAVQLAQTLRRFSGKGGGGIDILGTVRELTGLDDLRVEGIGTENATVGAGKYITDNVYLELEQGASAGSTGASIEVEVTPNVTVESSTNQSGDSNVGVFWEWTY